MSPGWGKLQCMTSDTALKQQDEGNKMAINDKVSCCLMDIEPQRNETLNKSIKNTYQLLSQVFSLLGS